MEKKRLDGKIGGKRLDYIIRKLDLNFITFLFFFTLSYISFVSLISSIISQEPKKINGSIFIKK